MSQAPASLLNELQNSYFFTLSLYALTERKGLQPTWEDHHIQIRWWGFKQKANYSGYGQEKDDIRRDNQEEKVLKKESL